MMKKTEKFIIGAVILLILMPCMAGCGREDAGAADAASLEDTSEKQEETEAGAAENTEALEAGASDSTEAKETVTEEEFEPRQEEILIKEFPFEESEPYLLTLSPLEETPRQYELRLYDKSGEILQQISCDKMEDPTDYRVYGIYHEHDREMLSIYNTEEADQRYTWYLWDGRKFSKIAVESKDGAIIEEDENVQIKTVYAYDYDTNWHEEARRWQLQKDTGILEIWDYLDEQMLFEGTVAFNEDGSLVNQEYYDMLFLDYMYDYRVNDDDADSTVKGGPEYEDGEWDYIEYESREAFLEQFGLENSEPVYRYYDWNGNLHLELYKEETKGQFYGITYEDYYYNGKGEKRAADVYGFPIEYVYEAEWTGEDAYSKMTEFKADEQDYVKDYEEFIEYTPAGMPDHFKSQGLIRTEAGEFLETVMGIDYVYRDDNTLFYRSYGHSSNVFQTTYGSRGSYYDEKGRVVYERGYHTNGYLRDYYIYEDGGAMPAYHLNIHYCHGGTNPSLSRIVP